MEESHLILASASPRRKELLEQVWLAADVFPADIEEKRQQGEKALDYVLRLAEEKARAVSEKYPESFILAADTIVIGADGQVLEKPLDQKDAARMLRELSGSTHKVATAFSVCCQSKNKSITKVVETEVEMVKLSEEEIDSYVMTEEPMDKAGSYAIQGTAAGFIKSIRGSYTNVVGLPVAEVMEVLIEEGVVEARL